MTDSPRCGHCGAPILPKTHNTGNEKIYCSRACKNKARALRDYSREKNATSTKHFKRLDRHQEYAAAWRKKAREEGRCTRCGRDNDRKIEGKLICSNCIIDIKG